MYSQNSGLEGNNKKTRNFSKPNFLTPILFFLFLPRISPSSRIRVSLDSYNFFEVYILSLTHTHIPFLLSFAESFSPPYFHELYLSLGRIVLFPSLFLTRILPQIPNKGRMPKSLSLTLIFPSCRVIINGRHQNFPNKYRVFPFWIFHVPKGRRMPKFSYKSYHSPFALAFSFARIFPNHDSLFFL